MMQQAGSLDKRREPRYRTQLAPCRLCRDDKAVGDGFLLNASRSGALLECEPVPPGPAMIEVCPVGQARISRSCTVLPPDKAPVHGCVVQFGQETLSEEELSGLVDYSRPPTEPENWAMMRLAEQDHEEVWEQVRAIQACRSTIFIGTMAAMAGSAFSVGAALLASQPDWRWVVMGSSIAFLFLSTGILATVEKARAINLRKGFLACLAHYLSRGRLGFRYLGWAKLSHSIADCGARHDAGHCPFDQKAADACWNVGRDAGSRIAKHKHMVPSILDSFTSFSASVYIIAYGLVCAVGLWAFAEVVSSSGGLAGGPSALTLLAGAGLALWGFYLVLQLYWLRKGRHSVEAYYYCWHCVLKRCKVFPAVP